MGKETFLKCLSEKISSSHERVIAKGITSCMAKVGILMVCFYHPELWKTVKAPPKEDSKKFLKRLKPYIRPPYRVYVNKKHIRVWYVPYVAYLRYLRLKEKDPELDIRAVYPPEQITFPVSLAIVDERVFSLEPNPDFIVTESKVVYCPLGNSLIP